MCQAGFWLLPLFFQLCLYFFDLYDLNSGISMPETVTRITQAFGVGCIVLAILYYLIPELLISSRVSGPVI